MKKNISHIIMMGDSLTDRGTLENRKLFGFIPMSIISGLIWRSPLGRFTNGYTWSDFTGAMLANQFIINHLKKKFYMDDTDIADAVATGDYRVTHEIQRAYTLSNDKFIQFEGRDFIRSYCEGGLSSHDYSWSPSTSLNRFVMRIILAHLELKRKELISYDKTHDSNSYHKLRTLIIEWSGANDFISANKRPSIEEADRVIKARSNNVKELINQGYSYFVLFNLPSLATTPRFQNMEGEEGDKERQNATRCTDYLNEQLRLSCERLRIRYPHCSFEIFDTHQVVDDIYQNPEKYHFDSSKIKTPYSTSPDFEINEDGTSPAHGYMFWDDIHPTADMHAWIAQKFYEQFRPLYEFEEPEPDADPNPEILLDEAELRDAFITKYQIRLEKDQHSFFGRFRKSHINYKEASLEEILKHALKEDGMRTRHVITRLQWIDKEGNLKLNIPAVRKALEAMKEEQGTEASLVI